MSIPSHSPQCDTICQRLMQDIESLTSLGHASKNATAHPNDLPSFDPRTFIFHEKQPTRWDGAYYMYRPNWIHVTEGMKQLLTKIQKDVNEAIQFAEDMRGASRGDVHDLLGLVQTLHVKFTALFPEKEDKPSVVRELLDVAINTKALSDKSQKGTITEKEKYQEELHIAKQIFSDYREVLKNKMFQLKTSEKAHEAAERKFAESLSGEELESVLPKLDESHKSHARQRAEKTKETHNAAASSTTHEDVESLAPPPPPPAFGGPPGAPPPPGAPGAPQAKKKPLTPEELEAAHNMKEKVRLRKLLEQRLDPDNWKTNRPPSNAVVTQIRSKIDAAEDLLKDLKDEGAKEAIEAKIQSYEKQIKGPLEPFQPSDTQAIVKKLNELTTEELTLLFILAYENLTDKQIEGNEILKRLGDISKEIPVLKDSFIVNNSESTSVIMENKDKWKDLLINQNLSEVIATECRTIIGARSRGKEKEPSYAPKPFRVAGAKEEAQLDPAAQRGALFDAIRGAPVLKKTPPKEEKAKELTEAEKLKQQMIEKATARAQKGGPSAAKSEEPKTDFRAGLKKAGQQQPVDENKLQEGYLKQFYKDKHDLILKEAKLSVGKLREIEDRLKVPTTEEEKMQLGEAGLQALQAELKSLETERERLKKILSDADLAKKAHAAKYNPEDPSAKEFIDKWEKAETEKYVEQKMKQRKERLGN